MKSINVTLLLILFTFFASAGSVDAKEFGTTEHVVAENVIEAVKEIDIISLNVLLAEGASVDTVDEAGNSPLMLAAKIGNPRLVEIILVHSPDIDRRNNEGNTALMIAAKTGVLQNVVKLIDAGANPEMTNAEGYSSVKIAKRYGHASIVEFLGGNQPVSLSR